MLDALEPTQDPGWVFRYEGYDVLGESALESRFAIGNGFLECVPPACVCWRGRSVKIQIAGRTVKATLTKGEAMEIRIGAILRRLTSSATQLAQI